MTTVTNSPSWPLLDVDAMYVNGWLDDCNTNEREDRSMLNEKPVGICPACGEAVFNSRETDGPVWTCPADLSDNNAYHKPTIMTDEQIEQNEREGYFGLCCEDSGNNRGSCYERLPLHSACYEKGDY